MWKNILHKRSILCDTSTKVLGEVRQLSIFNRGNNTSDTPLRKNRKQKLCYVQEEGLLHHGFKRLKHGKSSGRDDISHLFTPVSIQARSDEINVGAEISGPLKKEDILRILQLFFCDKNMKELALSHGLDSYIFQQTFISFRKFCVDSKTLPVDIHILISDVIQGAAHIHDLYPSFRRHALTIFPHLNCFEDLCKISDLSTPINWYPEARALNRKIIFHAGPTNSGKTYHAMQQFLCADSGVYCGPLKLLASEVFQKSNEKGTPCDLITGEERKYAHGEGNAASHVACTVEMASVNTLYDVAIVDEIQMLKDSTRGWAWTRALLGLNAREIHVCGEESAISLVKEIAMATGEDIEIRRYKRLTPLTIEQSGLQTLDNLHPGDCIVCFNKRDILQVTKDVERRGHEVAVIYGALPPGTKLQQAYKFNDPKHSCNVMVATDAIGMGLNLSIRRVIFYSLIKPRINESGEKEMDTLDVSTALQIAGRAGRYGTKWEHGYVTTMKSEDLPTLRRLLGSVPNELEQAGLHPTADQIEMFAYHLPTYTLSNLIDIFVSICTVDSSLYFMCIMDDFKFLADLIQHVPLDLRSRYVFCCAPINRKLPFVCATFLKFARQFSQNEPVTLDWLCNQIKWPFSAPRTILELVHLEEVFDVFDIYKWLSYRFPDMFPDVDLVRNLQFELDGMIQEGVSNLTYLFQVAPNRRIAAMVDTEETFAMDQKKKQKDKKRSLMEPKKLDKQTQKQMKRLAMRLIEQGVLSQKKLRELQNQTDNNEEEEDDDLPRS